MNGNEPQPTRGGGVQLAQPLLTAEQVATLLGIPRSSVYDYARRKHEPIPSLQIGRHRRFLQEDIERWLRRQRAA